MRSYLSLHKRTYAVDRILTYGAPALDDAYEAAGMGWTHPMLPLARSTRLKRHTSLPRFGQMHITIEVLSHSRGSIARIHPMSRLPHTLSTSLYPIVTQRNVTNWSEPIHPSSH